MGANRQWNIAWNERTQRTRTSLFSPKKAFHMYKTFNTHQVGPSVLGCIAASARAHVQRRSCGLLIHLRHSWIKDEQKSRGRKLESGGEGEGASAITCSPESFYQASARPCTCHLSALQTWWCQNLLKIKYRIYVSYLSSSKKGCWRQVLIYYIFFSFRFFFLSRVLGTWARAPGVGVMWWRTCVLVINGISETLPEQHRAAAFALLKFANGRNENQRSRRQFSANKPVSLQLHERSLFNISALIPPTARAPFYFKTTWEKKSDAEREQTGLAWLDSLLSRSPSKFILMPTFCLKKI